MKTLKYILIVLTALLAACSADDTETLTADELQGLALVQEIENGTHTVELFTASGKLQQGYNAISLRIKDKASGQFVKNADISWLPLMHMQTMQHTCPFSPVSKTPGTTEMYSGYIVFQMPQNDLEYWDLEINYTIDGTAYSVIGGIDVPASDMQRVASFTGTDGKKYVVALIGPATPEVAVNDITAGLFEMESMMSYKTVNGYTLKIDPRMPGMGNHGSPNNTDLVQSAEGGFYNGKISFTMTGYWRINLQLLNAADEVIKGEPVSETNSGSSIYFEVEF